MNYFQIVALVLPLIQAFVKAAEESNQPGDVKKEVVADQLKNAYEILQSTGSVKEIRGVPWEAIAPVALSLIDLIVNAYNKLNIFNHGKTN